MSLKPVELQIALPRTQEVTRIQEQQQQRSMHEQQELIAARRELDELARKRPGDVHQSVQGQVREKTDRERRRQQEQKQRAEIAQHPSAKDGKTLASDPIRGRHIDISL